MLNVHEFVFKDIQIFNLMYIHLEESVIQQHSSTCQYSYKRGHIPATKQTNEDTYQRPNRQTNVWNDLHIT